MPRSHDSNVLLALSSVLIVAGPAKSQNAVSGFQSPSRTSPASISTTTGRTRFAATSWRPR